MIEEIGKLIMQVASNPSVQAVTLLQSAKSLFDGAMRIRDIFFLEKLESFFIEIKSGTISEEGLLKFASFLEDASKSTEDICNLTIIAIDRLDRHYKAEYVAKLLNGLWNGKIRCDQFTDLMKIIEDWLDTDNDTLRTHKKLTSMSTSEKLNIKIDIARRNRLVSMGVVSKKPMRLGYIQSSEKIEDYTITTYGEILNQLFTRHIETPIDDFSHITTVFGDSVSNMGIADEETLKAVYPNAKQGDYAYVVSTNSNWYWNIYNSPPDWTNSLIEEMAYELLSEHEKKAGFYTVAPNRG